jgi:hypothetical protein
MNTIVKITFVDEHNCMPCRDRMSSQMAANNQDGGKGKGRGKSSIPHPPLPLGPPPGPPADPPPKKSSTDAGSAKKPPTEPKKANVNEMFSDQVSSLGVMFH